MHEGHYDQNYIDRQGEPIVGPLWVVLLESHKQEILWNKEIVVSISAAILAVLVILLDDLTGDTWEFISIAIVNAHMTEIYSQDRPDQKDSKDMNLDEGEIKRQRRTELRCKETIDIVPKYI
jgi:hypothetical protein